MFSISVLLIIIPITALSSRVIRFHLSTKKEMRAEKAAGCIHIIFSLLPLLTLARVETSCLNTVYSRFAAYIPLVSLLGFVKATLFIVRVVGINDMLFELADVVISRRSSRKKLTFRRKNLEKKSTMVKVLVGAMFWLPSEIPYSRIRFLV